MTNQKNCNCSDCENWNLREIGGWKGFVKQLYRHHKPSGGLLILRLVLGVLFAMAGWEKVTHMETTLASFTAMGFVPFEIYLLAWVELVGGVLIILGFLIKPTCVALAIPMAVAVWSIPGSTNSIYFGHDYQFVLLTCFLALYIAGPGKYSLAHLWLKRKKNTGTPL